MFLRLESGKRHFLNQHKELAQTGYENPHPTQILQNNKKKKSPDHPLRTINFFGWGMDDSDVHGFVCFIINDFVAPSLYLPV